MATQPHSISGYSSLSNLLWKCWKVALKTCNAESLDSFEKTLATYSRSQILQNSLSLQAHGYITVNCCQTLDLSSSAATVCHGHFWTGRRSVANWLHSEHNYNYQHICSLTGIRWHWVIQKMLFCCKQCYRCEIKLTRLVCNNARV